VNRPRIQESPGNIERGATGAELGSSLLPTQSLEEFPNTVAPYGKRRNLTEALDGAERGE